ncbi:MAG TPA: WYL domain-containing protein [Pseudolabrys sp.]|nr:WYL domain-containing protein [Pseudolabrys sp.]
MHKIITDAIRERWVVRLKYDPGERLIEPHAFGISAEGKLLVRAYQTEGVSKSGEHINWKLFRVDRIEKIEITQSKFIGTRPDYNPADPAMKSRIIACL